MSQRAPLTPTEQTAHRFVFELLKAHDLGQGSKEASLSRVRTLRGFLSPSRVQGLHHFQDRPDLVGVPAPAGTIPLENGIPYPVGQLLTQRVPVAGDLPAYTFPLPGQPVVLLGSPRGFAVPDGARYDFDTERWECEDARILAMSPMGPVVMTVDVEEFNPWTAASPVWSEVLEIADSLLDKLEADLVAAPEDEVKG